jgi:hypothetical protein
LIVVELGILLGTFVRLEFTSDTSSAVSFRTNFNQTDIPKGICELTFANKWKNRQEYQAGRFKGGDLETLKRPVVRVQQNACN